MIDMINYIEALREHLRCVEMLREKISKPYDPLTDGDDIVNYELVIKYYKLMVLSSDCARKGNIQLLKLVEPKLKQHIQECMENLQEQVEKGEINENVYLTWANTYGQSFKMFEDF